MEETGDRRRRRRMALGEDEGRGIPQGAPISLLLSNHYVRRSVRGWKVRGHERAVDVNVVNYADDLVIRCRASAEEAMTAQRNMMERLKLTVNESGTCLRRIPEDSVDFLGYTLGRWWSARTG